VIEQSKKFVPCTDEVYRLQRGSDPDCVFFQAIAKQGHFGKPTQLSKQGIYVLTADGTFLSSINSNRPDDVLKVLQDGLEKFESLPDSQKEMVDVAKIESKNRWESKSPTGGLILAIYSRDLNEDMSFASPRKEKWNRDTAWFSKAEIFAAIPQDLEAGATFEMPAMIGNRLLRFHIVDTIKGQTDEFSEAEVKSEIMCTVTSASDEKIEFEFSGTTKSDSNSTRNNRTPRGVVTKLRGVASFDRTAERFEKFDFVAIGYRWGKTRYNGRRRQANSSPIGFSGSLAPSDEPTTTPGLIYAYDAVWVF
jgi:hypothetical protein